MCIGKPQIERVTTESINLISIKTLEWRYIAAESNEGRGETLMPINIKCNLVLAA